MADMVQPSVRSCYPMASGPRRIMANMLLMAAFKVGNPIEEVVLMKVHDFTRRTNHFCSHGFHVSANSHFTLFAANSRKAPIRLSASNSSWSFGK
jgi:hypothetical protein